MFLNAVEAAVPAGKAVHAILDNGAAHRHPKVAIRICGILGGLMVAGFAILATPVEIA